MRFGLFEVDEQAGELRKEGRRLALQGQPIAILLLLLNRPGELVSRTEIHERLWPAGTYVDFDHSLNTAINKIREALGDSATNPRFVETLARRGYRFVAPVEVTEVSSPSLAPASSPGQGPLVSPCRALPSLAREAETGRASQGEPTFLTSPAEMPQASRPLVRTLFLLLQAMYFVFYALSLARLDILEDLIRPAVSHTLWVVVLILLSAVVGIPTRLYLISASAFNAPGLRENFLKIFPVIFPLDALWALAPFLLVEQIGYGLALGATAVLLYAPFAQRSLILMGAGAPARSTPAREGESGLPSARDNGP